MRKKKNTKKKIIFKDKMFFLFMSCETDTLRGLLRKRIPNGVKT